MQQWNTLDTNCIFANSYTSFNTLQFITVYIDHFRQANLCKKMKISGEIFHWEKVSMCIICIRYLLFIIITNLDAEVLGGGGPRNTS